MFVAFTVGALAFKRTRYEEADFAIGGSEEAARLLGMKVDWGEDHRLHGERRSR